MSHSNMISWLFEYSVLSRQESKHSLKKSMAVDEKLQKHFSYFDQFLRRAKREFEVKYTQEIKQNCSLSDFDILKTLGAGSFGMVVLCR